MPNFSSILDTPFVPSAKPQPLPIGTYLTVIKGMPRYDKSAKKQTPFVEFTHEFISAGPDVDTEALAEMGGCSGKTMTNTYYETENSLWRLDEFLGHCGFDLDDATAKGVSRRRMCEDTANTQVYVTIGHEPSQDGKSIFARIRGTARAD